MEISDCCGHLKIPHAVEIDKAYPRDFMQVGRVRFQLKKSDGSFWNPAISSKKALMLQIAQLVPKHHGRTKKQETAGSSSAAGAAGAGPSKSGKHGKKKK
ncbi:signal recognition particle 19 kDa protein-like [Carex rostrata]